MEGSCCLSNYCLCLFHDDLDRIRRRLLHCENRRISCARLLVPLFSRWLWIPHRLSGLCPPSQYYGQASVASWHYRCYIIPLHGVVRSSPLSQMMGSFIVNNYRAQNCFVILALNIWSVVILCVGMGVKMSDRVLLFIHVGKMKSIF